MGANVIIFPTNSIEMLLTIIIMTYTIIAAAYIISVLSSIIISLIASKTLILLTRFFWPFIVARLFSLKIKLGGFT